MTTVWHHPPDLLPRPPLWHASSSKISHDHCVNLCRDDVPQEHWSRGQELHGDGCWGGGGRSLRVSFPFLEASLNSTGWPRPEGVVNNINHGGERDSDRTRRCNVLDMESCCCCCCVWPVAGCHSATWNISQDFRERHQCVVLFLFLSNIKSILVTSCARKKNKIIRSNNWIKNCFHEFGNQYIKFYI